MYLHVQARRQIYKGGLPPLEHMYSLRVNAVQVEKGSHGEEKHGEKISSWDQGDGGVQGQEDQQAGIRQVPANIEAAKCQCP
jgi:hypothetical protein